jgi:hypothetical protein
MNVLARFPRIFRTWHDGKPLNFKMQQRMRISKTADNKHSKYKFTTTRHSTTPELHSASDIHLSHNSSP